MNADMVKRFHALISGRVQMVMFRNFTERIADRLGIVGMVKNLPDGKVEVFAEGEEKVLQELLEAIRRGPQLARVDAIELEWTDPIGNETEFLIVYE